MEEGSSATTQAIKSQVRNNNKNDLSKKLMVHYQKKYSIYVQKTYLSSEDKENQAKQTYEKA